MKSHEVESLLATRHTYAGLADSYEVEAPQLCDESAEEEVAPSLPRAHRMSKANGSLLLAFGVAVGLVGLASRAGWVRAAGGSGALDSSHDGYATFQEKASLPRSLPLVEARSILADFPPGSDKIYMPGWRFSFQHDGDTLSFDVLEGKSGLVQAFALNGASIVLNKPRPDQMDGSTFWPSPQNWGGSAWPPPPQLDVVPSIGMPKSELVPTNYSYLPKLDEASGVLELTSPAAPQVDMVIKKRFSVDPGRGAMLLDFEVLNTNSSAASWAPWEITRVPPGGLTFFATGSEPASWSAPQGDQFQEEDGISWFLQNESAAGGGGKLISDTASGFIAHTDGNLLLTKCFARIGRSDAAPNEGQIEIYNGGDYVEVENQGAYEEIAAGKVLTWRVLWFLRKLPSGLTAAAGRKALADFAKGLCETPHAPQPPGQASREQIFK